MINQLSIQIFENNKAKGFYDTDRNIGEMLCLIHSEVSEALECDRKNKTISHSPEYVAEQEGEKFKDCFERFIKDTFEDELADIMIRVMDLAAYKEIDLEKHIALKMRYNAMRPHKHGKLY